MGNDHVTLIQSQKSKQVSASDSRQNQLKRSLGSALIPASPIRSPGIQATPDPITLAGYSLRDIPLFPPEQLNRTGLPGTLKSGIERLSGLSLDDVRVHYNSSKPAEVQALAYTQGTNIYMGPGQEQHLAHEAWHVVQQMQRRVKPIQRVKSVAMNDDQRLEKEADAMGKRANLGERLVHAPEKERIRAEAGGRSGFYSRKEKIQSKTENGGVIQGMWPFSGHGYIWNRRPAATQQPATNRGIWPFTGWPFSYIWNWGPVVVPQNPQVNQQAANPQVNQQAANPQVNQQAANPQVNQQASFGQTQKDGVRNDLQLRRQQLWLLAQRVSQTAVANQMTAVANQMTVVINGLTAMDQEITYNVNVTVDANQLNKCQQGYETGLNRIKAQLRIAVLCARAIVASQQTTQLLAAVNNALNPGQGQPAPDPATQLANARNAEGHGRQSAQAAQGDLNMAMADIKNVRNANQVNNIIQAAQNAVQQANTDVQIAIRTRAAFEFPLLSQQIITQTAQSHNDYLALRNAVRTGSTATQTQPFIGTVQQSAQAALASWQRLQTVYAELVNQQPFGADYQARQQNSTQLQRELTWANTILNFRTAAQWLQVLGFEPPAVNGSLSWQPNGPQTVRVGVQQCHWHVTVSPEDANKSSITLNKVLRYNDRWQAIRNFHVTVVVDNNHRPHFRMNSSKQFTSLHPQDQNGLTDQQYDNIKNQLVAAMYIFFDHVGI